MTLTCGSHIQSQPVGSGQSATSAKPPPKTIEGVKLYQFLRVVLPGFLVKGYELDSAYFNGVKVDFFSTNKTSYRPIAHCLEKDKSPIRRIKNQTPKWDRKRSATGPLTPFVSLSHARWMQIECSHKLTDGFNFFLATNRRSLQFVVKIIKRSCLGKNWLLVAFLIWHGIGLGVT